MPHEEANGKEFQFPSAKIRMNRTVKISETEEKPVKGLVFEIPALGFTSIDEMKQNAIEDDYVLKAAWDAAKLDSRAYIGRIIDDLVGENPDISNEEIERTVNDAMLDWKLGEKHDPRPRTVNAVKAAGSASSEEKDEILRQILRERGLNEDQISQFITH